MTPVEIATLGVMAASAFAGAWAGQRVRLTTRWEARVERLALRAAGAALELERAYRVAAIAAALEDHRVLHHPPPNPRPNP